jgi:CRP/FNR family transcriptional regulator, anaerobic regulatory protein
MTLEEFHGIFPKFDNDLISHLYKIGKEEIFQEGTIIMRPGQYFKNSVLILDGKVKLYREGEDGGEFFLYHLEKGTACALSMICATKNETSDVKAKAMSTVKALVIPIQHMDSLMRDYRQWYYFVLETYRRRFEELLQVIDEVVFHSMDQKLEFYLKRQFQTVDDDKLTITHQEIAEDLNSSREVISRLLKKMESQNLISLSRHEIVRINI